MKKTVSVILCVTLLVCALPFAAAAAKTVASGACGEGLGWVLDADGTFTVSGAGTMDNYVSEEMGGNISPWYALRDKITKVVIKNDVQSVGEYAFYECENLKTVSFADSVAGIGAAAFWGCIRLDNVKIPEKVTTLNFDTFGHCHMLSSVQIPDTVRYIKGAFYRCRSLKDFTISKNVEEIDPDSFDGCTGMTRFTVSAENPLFAADENGVLFNKSKTKLIKYPSGKREKSYTVPDGVQTVGRDAFGFNLYVREIKLPDSVTAIEDYAFARCVALRDLVYNKNITVIREGAYLECYSLTDITLPAQIQTIGEYAFQDCKNLTTVRLSEKITFLHDYAFYGDERLQDVYIPKSVKTVGYAVFYGTSPKTVYFGGTAADWSAVEIDDYNDTLPEAAFRYNAKPADVPKDTPVYYVPGDVSGNVQVTAEDARLALRAAVGLEDYAPGTRAFLSADATGDETLTAEDARLILRAAVGLEELPGPAAELAVLIGFYSDLAENDVVYEKIAADYDLPADAWFFAFIESDGDLYNTEAQAGDIVIGVDGQTVVKYEEIMAGRAADEQITLTLARILADGTLKTFDVTCSLTLKPARGMSVYRP